MKTLFLPAPHPNARYGQSVMQIARNELAILLGEESADGIESLTLAGVRYLAADGEIGPARMRRATRLAGLLAVFRLANGKLTPIDKGEPGLAPDMPSILKYKGKTNETFTRTMINVAAFSACRDEDKLALLDPMMGKGTTLFCALGYGYDAVGLDVDRHAAQECATFAEAYFQRARYKYELRKTSLTPRQGSKAVPLTTFTVAPDKASFSADAQTLSVAAADALQAAQLFPHRKFNLIVADLPYGVQHAGSTGRKGADVLGLVTHALPGLVSLLPKGGAVCLSFNANTLPREKLLRAYEAAELTALRGGVYEGFEHWVEQAVTRDIAVGVK